MGYGLSDSPVGLAAWMYDKFAQWTYSGGEPERSLTKDEMLDDITLYWLTNSAISSAQLYWENNDNNFNAVAQKTADISIPVAVTVFPARSTVRHEAGPSRAITSSSTSTRSTRAVTSRRGNSRSFSRLNFGRRFVLCASQHRNDPSQGQVTA